MLSRALGSTFSEACNLSSWTMGHMDVDVALSGRGKGFLAGAAAAQQRSDYRCCQHCRVEHEGVRGCKFRQLARASQTALPGVDLA